MENGGQKIFFFSLSKKLVLSIIVVKLDIMCQIQKMYCGYFSISINFRPQYLVFSSKMFGYGSVTVRPFLLWFGFGSAEHEKSLFGRPLVIIIVREKTTTSLLVQCTSFI